MFRAVYCLDGDGERLPGRLFEQIKTFCFRHSDFLVASEELATEWVGVLNFTAGKSESIHLDLGGEDSDGYGRVDKEVAIDPRELFAIKSLRWESSKKLLNNRRLCFPGSPQGSTGGSPSSSPTTDHQETTRTGQ